MTRWTSSAKATGGCSNLAAECHHSSARSRSSGTISNSASATNAAAPMMANSGTLGCGAPDPRKDHPDHQHREHLRGHLDECVAQQRARIHPELHPPADRQRQQLRAEHMHQMQPGQQHEETPIEDRRNMRCLIHTEQRDEEPCPRVRGAAALRAASNTATANQNPCGSCVAPRPTQAAKNTIRVTNAGIAGPSSGRVRKRTDERGRPRSALIAAPVRVGPASAIAPRAGRCARHASAAPRRRMPAAAASGPRVPS